MNFAFYQEREPLPTVEIKFVKCHPEAKVPSQPHKPGENAGFDLYSTEYISIAPLQRKMISTGLRIQIPVGYYGRIAPRSGLALKNGIDLFGGVIDAGFKNEVKVILYNSNIDGENLRNPPNAFDTLFGQKNRFVINPGDRIAQIIFERCYHAEFIEVKELDESERGLTGLGDSGK